MEVVERSSHAKVDLSKILMGKIGVYSTILSYYGCILDWMKVYIRAWKKTNKYWKDKAEEFRSINTHLGYDLATLNYMLKVLKILGAPKVGSYPFTQFSNEHPNVFDPKDTTNDVDILVYKYNPYLFSFIRDFNIPKSANVNIEIHTSLTEDQNQELQDLVENVLNFKPASFKLEYSPYDAEEMTALERSIKPIIHLLPKARSSLTLSGCQLDQEDLITVLESCNHLKTLQILRWGIGNFYGRFTLDPDIDYQYETLNLMNTYDPSDYQSLNSAKLKKMLVAMSKTNLLDNLKTIEGVVNHGSYNPSHYNHGYNSWALKILKRLGYTDLAERLT